MVGRPQKRTQKTKQNILKIADKLFNKNGFDQTSVDQIAYAADVAKGTVFSHFGDKTSLLLAIKIDAISALIKSQSAINMTEKKPDLTKFLLSIYQPWLKTFRDSPDFAHIFLIQSTLKSGLWTEEFAKVCGEFESIIHANLQNFAEEGLISKECDIDLSTQALQAFYFHVLALYKGGYIKSATEQEALLQNLINGWLIRFETKA